jgi:ElaB/YqjD/DUF883 family membrane-anchored ribosome-binding protein
MARSNEEHHAKSATDDLKETVSEIGQNVREIGSEIGDLAREKFSDVRDQATGYYKKGRKKAAELEDTVEDYIKEQPIKALLIAAGVGLLVGMFWRRR